MRRLLLSLALVLGTGGPVLAHTGHSEAPGSESASGVTSGPIAVSEVAQRNLGLTVAEADLRAVETTLRVIGEIQADPVRSGTVSSRISGRVTALFAQEGERVRKGERLAEVESLQLGDPPPRVQYASPISGVVTDRHVVVGDDVEPNRHLFEVADLSEVLAIGRVFEGQIGQVSVGQKVRVRVPSYPEDSFEGIVERLGGKLDPRSRSLAVYIRVGNPDGRLRPHMRTTLSLVTGGADLALAIPKVAVLGEAGNLYAFVQDEDRSDRFERRALVIGVSNDRFIEVIEGLYPGERVVTQGNYSLQYLTPIAEEEEEEEHSEDAGPAAAAEDAAHAQSHAQFSPMILWSLGAFAALAAAALAMRMLRGRSRPAPEAR